MKDALKYALLAFGAWWLLKDYFSLPGADAIAEPAPSPGTQVPTPGAGVQPPAAPPVTPPTAPPVTPPAAPPPITPATLVNLVAEDLTIKNAAARDDTAAMVGNRYMFTADQWNWFYDQLMHTQTTTDLFTPGDRGELINAATYRDRRKAAGLSGLSFWRV